MNKKRAKGTQMKGIQKANVSKKEYPRPQFARKDWVNLNGEWDFEFNGVRSKILVPFCPESKLSGIGFTGFIESCRYKRSFELPDSFAGKRIFIRFGAVDYTARLYINSQFIGGHTGGFSPFSFEITDALRKGGNLIELNVEDGVGPAQPRGKQSIKTESYGAFYTRATGIWQTVYIEAVPQSFIKSVRFFPDIDKTTLTALAQTEGAGDLEIEVSYGGRRVGYAKTASDGRAEVEIKLSERHLWEAGKGRLYDVVLRFGGDVVESYFGLRSVGFKDGKFLLNGKPLFQRLVLDQGYYPDGVFTAPDEAAFIKDIKISMDLGFNGARLSQKVFEPRALYNCDRLGYLTWGEFGDWGMDYTDESNLPALLAQWLEAVERDFNCPSVITWCPLNETWGREYDKLKMRSAELVRALYRATKALDPARPCVDSSGGLHIDETDMYDVHNYEQDPVIFRNDCEMLFKDGSDPVLKQLAAGFPGLDYKYDGKLPVMVSEYGGCKFGDDKESWGYGGQPVTEGEFLKRYTDLTKTIMSDKRITGFCYTQIYDVEQEKNGLYKYDRTKKFNDSVYKGIAECNRAPAAIEKDKRNG